MAIIAILAALLLPMLLRAQEAAMAASCQSNLRQIRMASLMYSGDFDSITATIAYYDSGAASTASWRPWSAIYGAALPDDTDHYAPYKNQPALGLDYLPGVKAYSAAPPARAELGIANCPMTPFGTAGALGGDWSLYEVYGGLAVFNSPEVKHAVRSLRARVDGPTSGFGLGLLREGRLHPRLPLFGDTQFITNTGATKDGWNAGAGAMALDHANGYYPPSVGWHHFRGHLAAADGSASGYSPEDMAALYGRIPADDGSTPYIVVATGPFQPSVKFEF